MKKIILLSLISIIIIFQTFAEPMNLWLNDDSYDTFITLSAEDQFYSYLNSYKDKIDKHATSVKWSHRMVEQYGREIIPFINKELDGAYWGSSFKKPYDDTLGLLCYVLADLADYGHLTENEIKLYHDILIYKLDYHVLATKLIDGTVRSALNGIHYISIKDDVPYTSEECARYYEERLGITGIKVGNFYSLWEK